MIGATFEAKEDFLRESADANSSVQLTRLRKTGGFILMLDGLKVAGPLKTLLHCCANVALFACVKVLVDAGSFVNAIKALREKIFVDGYTTGVGSKVHGTPLDVLMQTEKLYETRQSDRLSQASK